MSKLNPKCLHNKELSLCYTGHVLPCCWINDQIDNIEWKEFFSDDMHLDNFETIDQIFATDTWKNLMYLLKHNPINAPKKCKLMCSVPLEKDIEGNKLKIGEEKS